MSEQSGRPARSCANPRTPSQIIGAWQMKQFAGTRFFRASRRFALQGSEQIGTMVEFHDLGAKLAPHSTQIFGVIHPPQVVALGEL